MATGATAKYALPYPLSTDPTNIPADVQALAAAVDSIFASDYSGTLAARPAAGKAGRLYTESSSTSGLAGTTWRDDGAAYRAVGSRVTAVSATDTIQVLRGASAHSGHAWEYQNSAGTPLAYFDSAGALNAPAATIGAYSVLTTNSSLAWGKLTGVPTLVNSVAGRTGAVSLSTSDISGSLVYTVAGRTGNVTLSTSDISGSLVNSVAGRTGTVTLSTSDISGLAAYVAGSLAFTASHLRRADAAVDTSWWYAGTGGQPSWLWGTNDGTTMQVYNPSNFAVSSAVSASSASAVPWGGVSSRPLTNIRGGQSTVTFSGGAATIAHGLGFAPTSVAITSISGGGTNIVVMLSGPTSSDGTNIYLRATNVSTSTNYSGSATLTWIAFG